MLEYGILGIVYGFAAAVQPGPFQAYLISRALQASWRRALPAAFAPLLSDGPVMVLALLVLRQLPARMEQGLHVAGGIFVLYLAVRAWRAWRDVDPATVESATTVRQSLLQAALVNLLNPGPYLGWSLVLGPLLLKGWRESPAGGVSLVAGFYSAMIASQAGIILLFSLAGNAGPRVKRVLIALSAGALACFGLYQLGLGLFG